MSVQRAYAQRNTNNTKIIPVFTGYLEHSEPIDISGSAIYTLTIPDSQKTGGVYYVDMGGNDLLGNPLNLDGKLYAANDTGNYMNIINFIINIEANPSICPGLEFTIFFRNIPTAGELAQLLTIGILSPTLPFLPFIVSPPFPYNFLPNTTQSLTFKSDGNNFNVISSGPAGWMGLLALEILFTATSVVG